ncbi:ribosomal protein S5 domain 2-type protein [Halteromyces radiatus]|uniref:ribosomal protein S5 domain 2-type protein n=1 Tax=Halteromyces radiatus TaxID=101107 RepID=UPI0022208310|nr:ribosomal protein S5 domain 2-type protein [Halteromyces radiatus]KAI8088668.1 ribosomal protein S5 domain 2-type protein [Halteromyces radiatus]
MSTRLDHRTDNKELRAFSASQNILNRADGSAKFSFGETSVLVSVCGPMDVSVRDEKLDEATVEVVVRPATGYAQTKEKLIENILRTTFEPIILSGMMPRTLIEIVVQIEKDDGSALSAAVNGVTLALLDAGLPMKYMAAAVTCMIDKTTDELVLDPTAKELENAASSHTFAFDSINKSSHVLLSNSSGQFSENQYFACHDLCFEAADKVHGFLRVSVESKKEKEYQQIHQ